MADTPIVFNEHCVLTALGISQEAISFATCTMESERYVCVREQVNGNNSVAIVGLEDASPSV